MEAPKPKTGYDLSGLDVPTAADVVTLLRPEFWRQRCPSEFAPERYSVNVVLLARCDVGFWTQRDILLEDYRPDGRDVLIVRERGEARALPLTSETMFVIDRYLAKRPVCDSPYLLVSRTGKRPFVQTMTIAFRRLEGHLRFKTRLPTLLRRFCVASLEKGGDPVAVRAFRGFKTDHGRGDSELPPVTYERLKRLVARTNPLKDYQREIRSEVAALKFLRRAEADVNLPLRNIVVPPKLKPPARLAASDHPAVAALMAATWPEDGPAQNLLRTELRDRYFDQIEELWTQCRIGKSQVAELFRMKPGAVAWWRNYAYRGGREKKRDYQPPKRSKRRRCAPASEAEKKILGELAVFAWSDDATAASLQRRRLLGRYFPAVSDMITSRKISVVRAADLFRMPYNAASFLRVGLLAGLSIDDLTAETRKVRLTDQVRSEILALYADRTRSETERSFYFRMFRKYGYPGDEGALLRFCRTSETPPDTAAPADADGDGATVNELLGLKWPADQAEMELLRRRMLKQHFPALDEMISAKKIGPARAARLLRLTVHQVSFLRAALRAGLSPSEELKDDAGTAVPDEVWQAVRREHERRKSGESDRGFYFRMRLNHGFAGSEHTLFEFCRRSRQEVRDLREDKSDAPVIPAFVWPSERDQTDAYRRKLLEEQFPAVNAMITAGTIGLRRAAKLFKVAARDVDYLRAALKAGLPIGEAIMDNRYARLPDEVWQEMRREHDRRDPDESDRTFYFRMRMTRDFSGCEGALGEFCRLLRREAAMSAAERGVLEELAAFAWSDDADEADHQRGDLLEKHFTAVSAMLSSETIGYAQAGELFRVPKRHVEYIRAAVAAGIAPREAARKNRHVRVPDECWARMKREYEASESGETDRAFYFRMRSEHGFPACEGIMSRFCRRMRKEKLARALASWTARPSKAPAHRPVPQMSVTVSSASV